VPSWTSSSRLGLWSPAPAMTSGPIFGLLVLLRARWLLRSGGWRALVESLPPKVEGPPQADISVERIVDGCAWAARRLPYSTACLERSYAACCLLRRVGVPVIFCVGVRRSSPLQFHAWLELDGRVINDAQAVRTTYRRLCSY
jgi:hypothetical protein